jgi:hypothetical protein
MDSDESVAFGAGLHAANMSTAFRVRKFGAVDAASYAMAVEFDSAAAATEVRVHHCAGRACEGTALGEPARALRWESLRGHCAGRACEGTALGEPARLRCVQGFPVGGELTRPFRDARRFPSTRL